MPHRRGPLPRALPRPPRRSAAVVLVALAALVTAVLPAAAQPVDRPAAAPAPLLRAAAAVPVTPGVSAIRLSDGSQRVYGVDSRGVVYEQRSGSPSWSGRMLLGAGFRSAPAAVYSASRHRIDLFAVTTAGRTLTRTHAGGGWGPWVALPVGGFAGPMTAAWTVNGGLMVFGRDSLTRVIGAIHTRQTGWRSTGVYARSVRGNVAFVLSGRDRMDLFSVDTAGRIVHRVGQSGRFGVWRTISRPGFAGGISAAVSGAGVWRVIARGTDGRPSELVFAGGVWRGPRVLGGTVSGVPAVLVTTPAGIGRYFAVAGGTILQRDAGRSCCGWRSLTAPPPPTTGPQLAAALLQRWGGRLTGTSGVLTDLRAEAAGRAIATPCGTRVRLDPPMLRMVLATTDRYQVFLYTMVTGHSCDSGYHPRGMAVDFNTVVDPVTGARTNWHTGTSGDNRALDAAFLGYAAARITTGGGAGQAQCAGSAAARLPRGMLRFADACTHQHLDTRR